MNTNVRHLFATLRSSATLGFLWAVAFILGLESANAQDPPPAQLGTVPVVAVDSIAVEGNSRLAVATIVGTLGFQAGSEVTYREIQSGIKALFATGQFSDIIVRAEGRVDEPVTLVLEVSEVDIVGAVTIAGLENASESEVRDTTGLQANLPYSPQKILNAKEFIRSELGKKGIPFAAIEERTEPVEGQTGVVRLFIDVSEGNRITIAAQELKEMRKMHVRLCRRKSRAKRMADSLPIHVDEEQLLV